MHTDTVDPQLSLLLLHLCIHFQQFQRLVTIDAFLVLNLFDVRDHRIRRHPSCQQLGSVVLYLPCRYVVKKVTGLSRFLGQHLQAEFS